MPKGINGRMDYSVTDNVFQSSDVLVLPRSCHLQVLKTAHDGTGHLGHRKVLQMLWQIFTWPLMTKDVIEHYQSCDTCQRCSKSFCQEGANGGTASAHEQVAFDIVGPLPKAKGGYRNVLTFICMATKWPEAVALLPLRV